MASGSSVPAELQLGQVPSQRAEDGGFCLKESILRPQDLSSCARLFLSLMEGQSQGTGERLLNSGRDRARSGLALIPSAPSPPQKADHSHISKDSWSLRPIHQLQDPASAMGMPRATLRLSSLARPPGLRRGRGCSA